MKKLLIIILFIFTSKILCAQFDTLFVYNNYRFKTGIKLLMQKSQWTITPTSIPVYNYGIQGVYKLGNSKSSLESGIYSYKRKMEYPYINPSINANWMREITFTNIHVPLKYRLDTKTIYFTIGVYGEYLLLTKADFLEDYYQTSSKDRKFNMGYIYSLGFEKPISTHFCLFIEGTVSANLSSMKADDDFLSYRSSRYEQIVNYGVALGINYKIPTKRN